MRSDARDEFFLEPGLTLLNHASYGLASRRVTAHAAVIAREIESDPTRFLGGALTERLRETTGKLAAELALPPAGTTLCTNATSGAAAVIDSVPLTAESTVVCLDTEYSSVLHAWERACARSGTRLVRVPVRLPFEGTEELIADLDAEVPAEIAYLQVSLVSSSTAIRFPVAELAAWARARGGRVILDAAHGPGHVPLAPAAWGVDAMFGTVHKWFPTLRPVGLLWLADDLVDVVRPAEVSLTWNSSDLIERFSWPGTFDPVPRLSLGEAVAQQRAWAAAGELDMSRELAEATVPLLAGLGAVPTTGPEHAPPRMHAFLLDGVTVPEVKAALDKADIRAWVGPGTSGECLLRVSTHVYNDFADLELLHSTLQEALR